MYYEIDEKAARAAHELNCMSDYHEGRTTSEYRGYVDRAEEIARRKKEAHPELADKIDALFDRYARCLAAWYNQNSRIEAMCPSVLVAGFSNFPVAKKERQKSRREAHRKTWDYVQGLLDKLEAIGTGGIKSGDANAIEKLQEKVDALVRSQEKMKEANAWYRKHKTLDGCPGVSKSYAEQITREGVYNCGEKGMPIELYGAPYPPYALSTNNAEIKRLRSRIEQLQKVKEAGTKEQNVDGIDGIRIVESAELMRVQIFFDEKPDEDVRAILKSNGFKWSPRFSAWQRILNENGKSAARYVVKKIKELEEKENA